MKIWVDADACPVVIRDILVRAAVRTGLHLTFVANSALGLPKHRLIDMMRVPQGFDVADNEIIARISSGDLVITSDIPLAASVIEKAAFALSPRGEMFSPDNIKERLNMRDFMDSMRASGVHTGGPPALSQTDRRAFANQLDALLARRG